MSGKIVFAYNHMNTGFLLSACESSERCVWHMGVLDWRFLPCQDPAASPCEWVNRQGHRDRIGRESMWEGQGETELEDVHGS